MGTDAGGREVASPPGQGPTPNSKGRWGQPRHRLVHPVPTLRSYRHTDTHNPARHSRPVKLRLSWLGVLTGTARATAYAGARDRDTRAEAVTIGRTSPATASSVRAAKPRLSGRGDGWSAMAGTGGDPGRTHTLRTLRLLLR